MPMEIRQESEIGRSEDARAEIQMSGSPLYQAYAAVRYITTSGHKCAMMHQTRDLLFGAVSRSRVPARCSPPSAGMWQCNRAPPAPAPKAATFYVDSNPLALLSASFRLPQLPPALHPTTFPAFVRIPYHINWDPSPPHQPPALRLPPSASRPPPPAAAARPPSAAHPPPAPSLPGLTAPYQALFRYTAPLQESQQIGSPAPPAPLPAPLAGHGSQNPLASLHLTEIPPAGLS
ncbi:hypothetical protein B0H14DRAFT_2611867 [Mycena olivaceomarginata]|nr:hypothetical protein B0H14DRAFT_2611867 [Mycena olivaceomarginata]